MELDILHRAVAPEIVEFFGAFTIESCVYYCMELMDAGSLDTLTGGGVPANQVKEGDEVPELRVPEPVLRRIAASMVRGLKFLKDELQIMHRGESKFRLSLVIMWRLADMPRRQADECVDQQERRSQTCRFRGIRTVGKEFGKDEYRLSELHGCKLMSSDHSGEHLTDNLA